MARYARIGRITKIMKLLKLLRLVKLQKGSSFSILSWIQELFQISQDFKWFFLFICYFTMTTHIVACTWIIGAQFDPNETENWMKSYEDTGKGEKYLQAFYFTVTTITTVGYGDMSAVTFTEKIICIFIMITGVIAFSLASGALTNYISQQEQKSEKYESKMNVLEQLQKDHKLKRNLYLRIRKNIENNHVEDLKCISEFIEDLPIDLRKPLSMEIYRHLYENVEFLKKKDETFISWICPALKTRVAAPLESIYYENDVLNCIYFLRSGSCNIVMPRYANTPFIKIVENTCFGLIDFVAAMLNKKDKLTSCDVLEALRLDHIECSEHSHSHHHQSEHDHAKKLATEEQEHEIF